jgi:hypothetical protein
MAVVLGSAGALGGGATYALTADAVSGPPKDGDQKDGDQKDGVHSGSAGDTSDASSSSGTSGGGGNSASDRGDNAARDMTILLTLGGNLPGIIVPSLCGSLVTDFSSRAEGYRLFWVLYYFSTYIWSHFHYLKRSISSPRQARDKHRKLYLCCQKRNRYCRLSSFLSLSQRSAHR